MFRYAHHTDSWCSLGTLVAMLGVPFGSTQIVRSWLLTLPVFFSPTPGRASLHGKASLQIDPVRSEDQGWYECRVLMLEQQYNTFHNGSWVQLTVNGELLAASQIAGPIGLWSKVVHYIGNRVPNMENDQIWWMGFYSVISSDVCACVIHDNVHLIAC
jgi:hypothetical protein